MSQLSVQTYKYSADRDPLTRAVMDRMLASVSTRKFARVGEPVGEEVERESRSTLKSTVSELLVDKTRTALGELMGRRLEDVRLAVMMLDGREIAERTHVVALGVSTDVVKIPARAVGGLDRQGHAGPPTAGRPRRAGAGQERNVTELLPERDRPRVLARGSAGSGR